MYELDILSEDEKNDMTIKILIFRNTFIEKKNINEYDETIFHKTKNDPNTFYIGSCYRTFDKKRNIIYFTSDNSPDKDTSLFYISEKNIHRYIQQKLLKYKEKYYYFILRTISSELNFKIDDMIVRNLKNKKANELVRMYHPKMVDKINGLTLILIFFGVGLFLFYFLNFYCL